jgi:hypothetical protein
MFKLFKKVVKKEMDAGTYRNRERRQSGVKFGRERN